MNRVRLATFDVTNCLLRFRRSLNDTYADIAAKHGLYLQHSQVGQVLPAFKESYRDVNDRFPCFGANHGLSSHEWWRQVTTGTFRRVGVIGESKRLERISNTLFHHFETPSEWVLDEGAPQLLSELHHCGIKMGVISNFDNRVLTLLQLFNVLLWFNFTVISQEAHFAKPSREIFDLAARKAAQFLEVDKAKWVHVGSDWDNDVLGAKNAGLKYAVRYSCAKKDEIPRELASLDGVFDVRNLVDVSKLVCDEKLLKEGSILRGYKTVFQNLN